MYANLSTFANLSLSLSPLFSLLFSSSPCFYLCLFLDSVADPEKRVNSHFSRVAAPRRSRHPVRARPRSQARKIFNSLLRGLRLSRRGAAARSESNAGSTGRDIDFT